jgi:predicted CxxxxCH...CXXCH cytochrome family protein
MARNDWHIHPDDGAVDGALRDVTSSADRNVGRAATAPDMSTGVGEADLDGGRVGGGAVTVGTIAGGMAFAASKASLGRVLALLLSSFLLPDVANALTITRYPSSNVASGADGSWGTPTNAYADDTAYASVTSVVARGAYASDFGTYGFDTAIPVGSTINSVTVGVAWYVSAALSRATTLSVQPYVSGASQGTALTNTAQPTSIYVEPTSPTYTLTRAQLLDGVFVVRASLTRGNVTTTQTGYLDYVSVTVDYTPPINDTTLGTVSAIQTTAGTPPSLAITANFSGDADADNSATYALSTNGGTTWSGETALTRNGSPTNTFTATASNLTCGQTYTVRVTVTDADGVTNNGATAAGVLMNACTLAQAPTASSSLCMTADVSAPFAQNVNASGSTSFARGPSGTGPWTPASCAAATGASPRACADAPPAAGSYYYQATFTDLDGVTGSPAVTATPVAVSTCGATNTTLGTVSASQSTAGSPPSIVISADFSGDSDADSSATYALSTNGGSTWSGETALTRNGSPTNTFTATAGNLTCGQTYTVRVTVTDLDGVVNNGATSPGVPMSNCTRVTGVTASTPVCGAAAVSAVFSQDTNNNGSTSFARSTTGGAPWTAATCSADTGASPRTCADAPAAGSYWYQATFTDVDGVTGSPVVTASSVTVTDCGPFQAEGSSNAHAPMVSIINPMKSGNPLKPTPVGTSFLLQIRVFNALVDGGIAATSSLQYSLDDGATWSSTGIVAMTRYDTSTSGTVTGRTYGVRINTTAGGKTLRARVSNAVPVANVLSNGVPVNAVSSLTGSAGDGNLLVRDNSSQLCADCHGGVKTHSTETTTTTYGSWSTNCRDCHTPHTTTNVGLVRQTISAPQRAAGAPTDKPVVLLDRNAAFTTGATKSGFANDATTGVCQVCHTATKFYLTTGLDRDGSTSGNPTTGHYYNQNCRGCHDHKKGLKASCSTCHGDASASPRTTFSVVSPPRDTCNATDTTTPGGTSAYNRVGAHEKHLIGGLRRTTAIPCSECHVESPTRPEHPANNCSDAVADRAVMTWGTFTKTGALNPTFDYTQQTCASTYCHGAKYTTAAYQGTIPSPDWNGGPSQAACGSCHKAPPSSPGHVDAGVTSATNCSGCHPDYNCIPDTTCATFQLPSKHIDGVGDGPAGCAGCHGTSSRTAQQALVWGGGETGDPLSGSPPNPSSGRTTTQTGPHLSHVYPASGAAQVIEPVKCSECHPGDKTLSHGTDASDDVAFTSSIRSALGGLPAPTWTFGTPYPATAGTCANNYCHGAKLPALAKGSIATWTWNTTTVADCGSCHGAAPGTPWHTSVADNRNACYVCHDKTVDNAGTILADATNAPFATQHIDGTVDVKVLACNACHGSVTNDAPPTAANTANGDAVGSHQSHVVAGNVSDALSCTECHGTGWQTYTQKHADGTADTLFGTTLSTGTAWTGNGNATSNCATSYCHGASATTPTGASSAQGFWGGQNVTPLWNTIAGGVYQQCNACHGNFPPLNTNNHHPPNSACVDCHGTGYSASVVVDPARATHVNGGVERTRTGCTECHGDATQVVASSENGLIAPGFNVNAADSTGQKVATAAAVGAHQAHLTNSLLKNNTVPATCTSCHASPMPSNTAHATGAGSGGARATVPFGAFAKTGGLTPSYGTSTTGSDYSTGATAGSCASTYCHGGKYTTIEYAGTDNSPSWTAGSAGAACGACHKVPPSSPGHVDAGVTSATNCSGCHPGYNCIPDTTCATFQLPSNHIDGVGEGPAGCAGCHLAGASAGATSDFDNYVAGGGKPMIDRDEWGATGHGATVAYDSGNAAAGFPVVSNGIEGCYYCHAPDQALYVGGQTSAHSYTINPFRLANIGAGATTTEKNGVCLVCHGVGTTTGFDPDAGGLVFTLGKNSTKKVDSTHYGADHLLVGAGQGGQYCWDCHDPHGDFTAAQAGIAYMIQRQPVRTHTAVTTSDWGMPDKATELGTAVTFAKAGGLDAANFDGGDYVNTTSLNGVCQSCHTKTTYWLANGTDSKSHEYATANTPVRCVACHKHQQTTQGQDAFLNVSPTNCAGCHNAPPTLGKHGKHDATGTSVTSYTDTASHSTAAAYGFSCGMCHGGVSANHMDDAGGTATDPYVVDVDFTWDAVVYGQGATTANETHATTGLVFKSTNGSCATTYCHDPLGAAYTPPVDPTWATTAAAMTCTGCHDDANGQATTALPIAHGKHSTNAAGAYNYICQTCHANTVDGTGAISSKSVHVNNNKNDVKFTSVGGINQAAGTFSGGTSGTCSATYCHSDGKSQSAFGSSTSPAWNGAGGCGICHGTGAATSTTLSAAHYKHVDTVASDGYGYTCDRCHTSTVNASNAILWSAGVTQHVDGDVDGDVKFNALPIAAPAATYTPATSQCNSTYCHSNGQTTASPFGSNVSIAWTAAGGCNKCHDVGGGTSTTLGGKHAIHVNATGSSGYNYDCAVCHTNTGGTLAGITNKANHVDADFTHDVAFSTLFAQNAGTYDYTTTQTCSNTYCHSDGTDRSSPYTTASIAWSVTKTCVSCHKGDVGQTGNVMGTNGGTPRHANHVNNTAVIGANVQCGVCHSATVSGNTTPTATFYTTNHVNQNPDVSLAAVGGRTGGTYDGTAHTCASNWCHSSGEATPQYVSADWDLTWSTSVCTNCHGAFPSTDARYDFAPKAGEPNYINGGKAAATANSHQAHVTLANGTECYTCHKNTADLAGNKIPTTATQHLNGAQDVALDTANAKVGAGATYTAGKTCNNVVCHGGTGSLVQWGDPNVTCRTCHMKAGVGVDNDTDDYTYGNNTVAAIDQEDWLAYGHGATAAYTESGNPRANFDNSGATAVDGCLYCHETTANGVGHGLDTNPFRLKNVAGADGKNGACLICHKSGSTGVTVAGVARNRTTSPIVAEDHYGALHTSALAGGQLCWDCHDPHGDYNYVSAAANKRIANMIQELPVKAHATAADPNGWGIPNPATELAPTPDFRSDRDGTAGWAWGDYVSNTLVSSTYRGVCQVCHTQTSVFRSTTYLATHYNSGNPTCTATCHSHSHTPVSVNDAFKAPDCRVCHGTQTQDDTTLAGSTRAVDADFAKTSHHVGNGGSFLIGTLTNNDCAVCHAEATVATKGGAVSVNGALHKNSKIDLRDADSTTAYFQYDAVAIKALTTATANSGNNTWKQQMSGQTTDAVGGGASCGTNCTQGLDRFCITCHDANGASQAQNYGDSNADALNPFGDTRISNEYDRADRTRVTDIASRIDESARGTITPTDFDSGYGPTGVTVRTADARNDPPEGVFSRHAIRGLSVSVYGATNTNLDGATQVIGTDGTYWKRTTWAWNSKSVMSCADCHTSDGINTTTGNAHGSNSEYMLKNASGAAVSGRLGTRTVAGSYGCYACHLVARYDPEGASFDHTGNAGDYQDYVTLLGSARIPVSSSGGNVYGYACGNCHGGGPPNKTGATFPAGTTGATGFGTIHGTTQVLGIASATGTARPAYRFTNGNSMRYYDPIDWSSTTTRGCYTVGGGDAWGGCTKHSSSAGNQNMSASKQRPLKY